MSKIDIKIGDLVKLRDDLEDGRYYETDIFLNYMKFKGFKKVKFINTDTGEFNIDGMTLWYTKEMIAEVKRPYQYKTIYKREEPILDDKEKEYLSAVIRPFKEKVSYIVKHAEISDYGGEEIYIYYKCMSGEFSNGIILPSFEAGTMYKGMELYKKYTLEELGL